MLLAPVVWILTAIIAYFFAAKTWWFPPPINAHGIAYDEQFMRTLWVTGIIFVLAQFALGWVIFRFRNDGKRADYSHGNNRLETVWTSATALLFLGLVLAGSKIWATVHFDAPPADAVPIEVLAKQFAAESGAQEAWLVEDGVVTEGASSTAWIVKGKTLISRPLSPPGRACSYSWPVASSHWPREPQYTPLKSQITLWLFGRQSSRYS